MLTWEQQPPNIKIDYDKVKIYFERIIKATDTYEQNAGGGTAGRNRYDSANQMADYGDDIRVYIQQLVSVGAVSATDAAANVQTKEKLSTVKAEIKKLTATIAAMATKLTNNENKDPTAGGATGDSKSRHPQMKKPATCEHIATPTAFIQSAPTTTARIADGRSPTTMLPPPGTTNLTATCFGHPPNASPLNNTITTCGKESRPPPTDRDWGLRRTRKR